jgi:hypothetical protein
MKKILFLIIGLLSLVSFQADAQTTEKTKTKVEKKVVIKKKVVDKDGNVTETTTEAEGAEAEALIKKMKEEEGLEDIEMEIEMEDGKKIMKTKKMSTEHKVLHKSHDGEKTIKVTVDGEGHEEGENVFVIKVDDGDGERIMKWNGKDGEIPMDMKKYLQEGNMKIFIDKDDADMGEVTVWVDSEKEDMPEVNVRMGIEIIDNNGSIEVGGTIDDSPAAKAGLQEGDLITEIDGYHISGINGLMKRLSTHKAGDQIEVRYIREGKASTTKLKLEGRE